MTETQAIDKIHKLPEPVRQHLYLYLDFLYHTYSNEQELDNGGKPARDFFEKNELTEAGKEWLEKRAEQAFANPGKNMPWREARDRIHKKHSLRQ